MKKQYNLKDSSSIYILAILIPIIVSFALSFVLGIISIITKIEAENLLSNIWVYSLVLLISQGSFLAIVLLYNKKKNINTFSATTLSKKVGILNYIIVAGISVASLFLFLPLINWFDALIRSWGYSASGDLPFAINNIPSLIVALFSLALLPAICEEIVFRGAIFNGIKNTIGAKKAIILSALCFCIMHMSLQQTLYPLILGVVLALILHFTGSVRATIFAHFCNNAIVVVSNFMASFSQQTEQIELKVNFQTTISAFVWLIVGCGVVALGCWLLKIVNKQKTEANQAQETEKNNLSHQLLGEINSTESVNNSISYELNNSNTNIIETQQKTFLKADIKIFWLYIGISLVMWIVENIIYFLG